MKAKDFIIIGGAIALYYLYQKNKTKTSTTSTVEAEAQEDLTPSGGGGGGGVSMPSSGAVIPKPATSNPVRGVIVRGTVSDSEAIFTGNPLINTISTIVDSPIRNITNPEIIVGGTIPIPALVPSPIQTPEEALISGGIAPIVRPNRNISTEII